MAARKKSSVRKEVEGLKYIRDHLYRMDDVVDRMVDDILEETEIDSVLGLLGVEVPNEPVKINTMASRFGVAPPRYLVGLYGKKKDLKRRLHALPSLTACVLLTFTYRNIAGLLRRAYEVMRSLGGMFPTTFWTFGKMTAPSTTVKVDASLVKSFFMFLYSFVLLLVQASPVLAASHIYSNAEISTLKEKMESFVGTVKKGVPRTRSRVRAPTSEDLTTLLNGVQEHKTALSTVVLGTFVVTNAAFVAMDRASQAELVREIQTIFKDAIDRKLKSLYQYQNQESVLDHERPAAATATATAAGGGGGISKKKNRQRRNKIPGSMYTRKWK
jgi:hypothetical protein